MAIFYSEDQVDTLLAAATDALRTSLKAEILGGANAAADTLAELEALRAAGDAADQDDIAALAVVVGTKAPATASALAYRLRPRVDVNPDGSWPALASVLPAGYVGPVDFHAEHSPATTLQRPPSNHSADSWCKKVSQDYV